MKKERDVPYSLRKRLILLRNGAQGRNRTTDTAIFSRVLYQLSYLGESERSEPPDVKGVALCA